jgi:CheY-like chemotaxis protein
MTLPPRTFGEASPPVAGAADAGPAPHMGAPRARVLVVGDNDIDRELMLAAAARIGLIAAIACDGEQAIERIAAAEAAGTPFDLMLMDMQMPKLDGPEATRRLRAAGHGADRLPIVALTANAHADDVAACLAAGMQHHLSKPVSAEDLTGVLARFAPQPVAKAEPPGADPLLAGLRARYDARKAQLFADVEAIASSPSVSDDDVAALAGALHQFAGLAGMFGDAALGEAAAALEETLQTAGDEARRMAAQAWLEQCGPPTSGGMAAADGGS